MKFLEKLNDIFVQKAFAGSLGSQINESTDFSNVSDHNDLTKKIVEIADRRAHV